MPTKLQRNKLNNFIKYMKPYKVLTKCIVNISNGNFAMPKPLGIMAIAPFGLLFILFNVTNINVANALSITVDGGTSTTKSFQLIPGSSNTSGNVAISVASSDAAGGYTLSMTGPNAAKTLIGTNASNVLNSIASTTWTSPSSFGDDTWGILPSKLCTGSTTDTCSNNTAYKPAPGTSTQIIDVTTSANATATTYALAFGAKVSDTKTPDTYTGTITMTLTANATPYSIGFIDATNNMPDTIHGSTTNSSVILPPNIPTKDGYTFIGWCSVRTTDSTCSGTTYQPGGTYTLSNGAMTNLYAMWETATIRYMQDISTWASTMIPNNGDTTTAIDSRDNKEYMVGRLADGKIWMLDNLAFDGTNGDGVTYIEMNSTNTNLPAGTTKTWSSSVLWTASSSYNSSMVLAASEGNPCTGSCNEPKLQDNSDQFDASNSNSGMIGVDTSSWKYGVHYNYCAASAETICSGGSYSDASSSVCPAGWKLPPSDSLFSLYYTAYSNNYANSVKALRLPLSGGVYNGSLSGGGSYGHFWYSTDYDYYQVFGGYFDTSSIGSSNRYSRDPGFAIRCIVQ